MFISEVDKIILSSRVIMEVKYHNIFNVLEYIIMCDIGKILINVMLLLDQGS